ncbi:MAG: FkbM family methyltransferase [Nitrososphaeria archaeon]
MLEPLRCICLKTEGFQHIILPDGFGAFEEIFIKQIYFSVEEIARADLVIDLGAHQGTFSTYAILHMKPGSVLVAVEPNPRAFSVLAENIHLLQQVIAVKQLKVHLINKAIYIHPGAVHLKITKFSETAHISCFGSMKVPSVTLKQLLIFGHNQEKSRILLKMDIEGTENVLLKDENSLKCMKMCECIAMEPHGGIHQIKRTLENNGFKVRIKDFTLEPSLFRTWLNYKPLPYTVLISVYRFVVSLLAKPKITIVKAQPR